MAKVTTEEDVQVFGNGLPGACSYHTQAYDEEDSKQLAFLVLTSSSKSAAKNGSSDGVFELTAPIQSIRIQQTVDFSITKSLDSDFLVATFGDMPVQITLSGLHLIRMANGNYRPITDWYKDNRVSEDKSNRVKVSISLAGGDAAVYKCVVVSLELEGDKESIDFGTVSYKMSLFGVEVK